MLKKIKNILYYILVIGAFSMLFYWIVEKGKLLETGRDIVLPSVGENAWMEFIHSFSINLEHPLAILLIQIVTIILTARLLGILCRKIGQPTVIGEIAAGILLGPSLLGMYFPELSAGLS